MDENQIAKIISGLNFNCQKCSNCCRHEPGAVFLTDEDFSGMAKFLNIDSDSLLNKYCRGLERPEYTVVALKEKSNYDCIFWDNGCTIYPARPLQCRTFPFWPSLVESKADWKNEKYRCKGIDLPGNMSTDEKINLYNLEKRSKYMKMPE
jgi:uncharacterized protein